jgi:hypothetical protein
MNCQLKMDKKTPTQNGKYYYGNSNGNKHDLVVRKNAHQLLLKNNNISNNVIMLIMSIL